jgi:perosamine synthetase
MFNLKHTLGEHQIFAYDAVIHPFRAYFEQLYGTSELETLHTASSEYMQFVRGDISDISDYETDLHKRFYMDIKSSPTFKTLYCNLIKAIHTQFFPEQDYLIYQSFPSVRFQYPNSIAVPPHHDADDLGKHPLGEKNFLLPITDMYGSKRLFIETEPGKRDFVGIDLSGGIDLLFFNGNKCTHYNQSNIEGSLRISLDFRVMLPADYKKYLLSGSITTTNPRDPDRKRIPTKMIVGGYYQLTKRGESLDTMMNWHFQRELLLQSRPVFGEEEALACYTYMREDNFVTEFKQTEALERALAQFIGVKHCIMTTSGNSAIILALMAAGIGAGDEVIVPNYTMIATVNSVRMVGATPILVDVNDQMLTLDIPTLQRHWTQRTKAVLHVSLNNRHCNIAAIRAFCDEKGVPLIEDAAQSLGYFVEGGKHMGTFGAMGCFSLSTPKIISTGQGGFVVTDNDEYARTVQMMKNFGRKTGGIDDFETFGLNLKFTDIQAVIGLEQVKRLPERIERLKNIYSLYYKELIGASCVRMIAPLDEGWLPWFVDIFVEGREDLMAFLKCHNIQTRATYPEINKTPMYMNDIVHPVSSYVSAKGLFLPTHMKLTDREIKHICDVIQLFCAY